MDGVVAYDSDMFKLTSENYSYWKPMMEDHLYYKDLHEPIITKEKPEGKNKKDWELLNRKAVAVIRKYIDKSLFEHVSTYTNAFELWTKLDSMIQKKTPRNKASLVRRLVKLEYQDGQSMIEHLNSFKGLVNQLTKADMKIEDELQALLLQQHILEILFFPTHNTFLVSLYCNRKAATRITGASIALLGLSSLFSDISFYWVVLIFILQRGPIAPLSEEVTDPDNKYVALGITVLLLGLLICLPYPFLFSNDTVSSL